MPKIADIEIALLCSRFDDATWFLFSGWAVYLESPASQSVCPGWRCYKHLSPTLRTVLFTKPGLKGCEGKDLKLDVLVTGKPVNAVNE